MIDLGGISSADLLAGAAIQLCFTAVRVVVALTVLTKLSASIPMPARASIGLSVGCLGLTAVPPSQLAHLSTLPPSTLLASSIFDVCWVVLLVAPTALALEMLPTAGRLIDTFRGNQLAEQLLPDLSDRVSPLEYAGGLLAAWLFVESGSLHELLGSLMYDTQVMQTGGAFRAFDAAERGASSYEVLLQAAGSAVYGGLRIAMPVLVVCLVIDAAALAISRIVPRISIATELSAVKLVVGLVLTALLASHQQFSRSTIPVSSVARDRGQSISGWPEALPLEPYPVAARGVGLGQAQGGEVR